jgi:hypothetical protein
MGSAVAAGCQASYIWSLNVTFLLFVMLLYVIAAQVEASCMGSAVAAGSQTIFMVLGFTLLLFADAAVSAWCAGRGQPHGLYSSNRQSGQLYLVLECHSSPVC